MDSFDNVNLEYPFDQDLTFVERRLAKTLRELSALAVSNPESVLTIIKKLEQNTTYTEMQSVFYYLGTLRGILVTTPFSGSNVKLLMQSHEDAGVLDIKTEDYFGRRKV